MKIVPYTPARRRDWNGLVETAKNGTFLLDRNFMDYHAHRFTDCSLMAYDDGGQPAALLPANRDDSTGTIASHGGLTYGGLVVGRTATARQVMDAWCGMLRWYRENTPARRLFYKPIPYIYNTYPAEEPLYALFRSGATLKARSLSSALPLGAPLPMRTLRVRGMKKAARGGWTVAEETEETALREFWDILDGVLAGRHRTHPVHSPEELLLLWRRFPANIRLFTVRKDGRMAGGCVVFHTPAVAHVQYIAADEEGRSCGALDLLFARLIGGTLFPDTPWLDFGISTENEGAWLNEGLIFQKEGFGARGVCYDTYEIELQNPRLASLLNDHTL